jgi:hypothetical protein
MLCRYMRETEYYVGWVGGQVGLIVGRFLGRTMLTMTEEAIPSR